MTAPTKTADDRAKAILAALDDNVRRAMWVSFENAMGAFEYHAMRLIAARERRGPGWVVVLETVSGDYLDEHPEAVDAAGVRATACGGNFGEASARRPLPSRTRRPLGIAVKGARNGRSPRVSGLVLHGPRGSLAMADQMLERLDLRAGKLCGPLPGGSADANLVLLIRAYLATFPGAFWGDPAAAVRAFGLDEDLEVVVLSDAFQHVVGPAEPTNSALAKHAMLPSESATYRSLARALAAGDASLFNAGTSNLDWRQWAVFDDEGLLAPTPARPRSTRRAK